MDNLYEGKAFVPDDFYDGYYLNVNTLYLHLHKQLPSVVNIRAIDGVKAYNQFREKYKDNIVQQYKNHVYCQTKKVCAYDRAVIVLNNKMVVKLDEGFCEIFHDNTQNSFLQELVQLFAGCKGRKKRGPLEINLIVQDSSGMDLKAMEIKRTKLDIDLFYEDDFKAVDEIIRARLNRKNDKGIVLLHGLPGTGKTSYLRYLMGKIKKRILFLSPNVAGDLMNPGFMDLLINNPDTVLIIEDAENIIMDRRATGSSSVSNLLNISDGLLADFLNVQIICTFNSELTLIDSALLRKGRLIARYEFGKLSIAKVQRLSNHLGYNKTINRPMTVAEISNQKEATFENRQVQVIGFRSHTAEQTA